MIADNITSTADATALRQLADIHLPEAVSWWPPAPGWWLLLLLLIFVAATLFWRHSRACAQPTRPTAKAHKQQLKEELNSIQRQWQQQANIVLSSARLSQLLRLVALEYDGREQVAALTQQDWLDYLQQQLKIPLDENMQAILLNLAYQNPVQHHLDTPQKNAEQPQMADSPAPQYALALDRLLTASKQWIERM